jgi:hypothetical protein
LQALKEFIQKEFALPLHIDILRRLDYSIGFLHEINQSRTPLVYDIQELFRWLIDISVIQLLEEKKIKKSDFIITENYHTRLGENVAKLFIEKINSNFNARYNYKNSKNYSYQIILQDNLQQLVNFIVNKKKEFDFIDFMLSCVIIELLLYSNSIISPLKIEYQLLLIKCTLSL